MSGTVSILRLPAVQLRVGLSRSQIYHLASRGEFPKPIKIGARSSGWPSTSIDRFIEQRIRAAAQGA